MMKNKRWMASLAVFMAVGLCACGNTVAVKTKEPATEEKVTTKKEKTKKKDNEKETEKDIEKETEKKTGKEEGEEKKEDGGILSVKQGKEYKEEYDDNYNNIAGLEYAMIHLGEEEKKTYGALAKELENFNKEKKKNMEAEYKDLVVEAKENMAYAPDGFIRHMIKEDIEVRRADNVVLSFICDGSVYQGGAHGYYYNMGVNYDVSTGKQLRLKEVVADEENLPKYIEEKLKKYWKKEELYDDLNLEEMFSENETSEYEPSWVLDYYGLTIIFNPYEIAPFASGMQIVTLTFDEYPTLIKEKYRSEESSYCIELSCNERFYFDLNEDGETEEIMVLAYPTEYENYEKQSIMMDGKTLEDDTDGFSVEPVLMHTAEGKNFLYIANSMMSALGQITIYDLNGKEPEKVDRVYYCWRDIEDEESYGKYLPMRPESFELCNRTEVLGTIIGHRSYHVGDNGVPEAETEWFDFDHQPELTMKKDLKVKLVDEKTGKEKGTETLKEGTKVTYYRTDNQKYADLLLSDGKIARVYVDNKEGMYYIEDEYIEEIFDGIMYAG